MTFKDPSGVVIAFDPATRELMAKTAGSAFVNADKLSRSIPPCPPFTESGTWNEFLGTIQSDPALIAQFIRFVRGESSAAAQKIYNTRKVPLSSKRFDVFAIRPDGGYTMPIPVLVKLLGPKVWLPSIVSYESKISVTVRRPIEFQNGRHHFGRQLEKTAAGRKLMAEDDAALARARRKMVTHPVLLDLDFKMGPDRFSVDSVAALEHPVLRQVMNMHMGFSATPAHKAHLEWRRREDRAPWSINGSSKSRVIRSVSTDIWSKSYIEKGRLIIPFSDLANKFEMELLFEYILSTPQGRQAADRDAGAKYPSTNPLVDILETYDRDEKKKTVVSTRVPGCLQAMLRRPDLKNDYRKVIGHAIASGVPIDLKGSAITPDRQKEIRAWVESYSKRPDARQPDCLNACGMFCTHGRNKYACMLSMTGKKVPFGSLEGKSVTQMAIEYE